MRIFLCLIFMWATLTACEDSSVTLESTFSIQLPVSGGSYEKVAIWARQSGEDIFAQKVSETEYRFVLEPDVSAEVMAKILETTRTSQTTVAADSLESQTEEFIGLWIAWEGTTGEFTPVPGINEKFLRFPEAPTNQIQFDPVMVDSDGKDYVWEGSWLGVEVKDMELGYALSKPLAQTVAVPIAREIEYRGIHPLGEHPNFESTHTGLWEAGAVITVSLGAPPAPLPAQRVIQVSPEGAPVTLDYAQIYGVQGYGLDCSIPAQISDSAVPVCGEGLEWIPCASLALPAPPAGSFSVCVRYHEIPTLGVSQLTVNLETSLVALNVSLRLSGDQNEQFLEVGVEGWQSRQFFVNASQIIAPVGTPTIGALDLADGLENVNSIEGVTCTWDSPEPAATLSATCTAAQGQVNDAFSEKMAVIDVKYALPEVLDYEMGTRGYYRVLGLANTTNIPTITAVVPAYQQLGVAAGQLSSKAQFARYWVQVAILRREIESRDAQLSLNGRIVAGDELTEVGSLREPLSFDMTWDPQNDGITTKWVEVDITRDSTQDATSELNKSLSLTLGKPNADGTDIEVLDQHTKPVVFGQQDVQFLKQSPNQTLRFPADFSVFEASEAFQWPVVGLGLNRGGYVFDHSIGAPAHTFSTNVYEDPVMSLEGTAGSYPGDAKYEVRLGNFIDYSSNTDYLNSGALSAISVELVRPSRPASLLLNKLRIGNQVFDVDNDTLGELQRLLWEPHDQSLVVVGENGFELFRLLNFSGEDAEAGVDPTWASIGTIVPAQLGAVCTGVIADAAIRSYRDGPFLQFTADAGGPRHSRIDFLTAPVFSGDNSISAQHCWIDLEGLDSQEAVGTISASTNTIGSFSLESLSPGDCVASLDSAEMVLSYNALNDTFWALSKDCLVGYRTRDTLSESVGALKTIALNGVPANPRNLTIDPHSGVAIARYWSEDAGSVFQRIILQGEPRFEPGTSQVYANRDAMVFDPVRNWNWEGVNLVDNTGSEPQKNYYLLPSVEPSQSLSFDVDPFFQNEAYQDLGFGMNHAVLDASRDMIHSLRVDISGTSAQLTQERHQISDAGGVNVVTHEVASWAQPVDSSGDFTSDPVIDVVLIGPQITGSLPQAIRPGDYVTLLGKSFSGDISRDKVCIQGICVAPKWSTPTTLSFQVPQVFQTLDVPLRAHVTVDNGVLMSGPAPGVSMLERRDELWGNPGWSGQYSVACGSSESDLCSAGTIYQGLDGLHLSVETEAGEVRGYKVQGGVSNWSSDLLGGALVPFAPVVGGNPSLTPSGRNTNLIFGQTSGNGMAIMEARVRATMGVQTTLPVQAVLSNYLASSSENSRNRSMWYTEQHLEATIEPEKLLMSASQAIVGFQESLESSEYDFGVSFSGRHITDFTGPEFDFSTYPAAVEPLPGRGGFMVAERSGSVSLALKNWEGGSLVDYAVSEICGWPDAQEFRVVGTTGATAVVGMAVLDWPNLHVGVASMTQVAGLDGSFQKDCTTTEYNTGSTNDVNKLQFKVSADGRFFVIGFGSEASYSLKVWKSEGLEPLATRTVAGVPLDIEFSDSGDELYVLLSDKFKVMSFNTTPFGD